MPKTLCFDLDGTLCSNTFGAYESADPVPWAIARVNALGRAGHRIVIFTARGSATGIDWRERTRAQLERWGVHYDELVVGKPSADVYVDDRAVHADAWHAGDAFDPPGFCGNGRAGDALPAVLPAHVSCLVETGRTFGGEPARLDEHLRRLRSAAHAAGMRAYEDDAALVARVGASIADAGPVAADDVVYAITLADPPTAAHIDIGPALVSAVVGVACRPLADVMGGVASLVAPGAREIIVPAEVCSEPELPADAWPLLRTADGTVQDALGGAVGVVRDGALRVQPPAGPPSVAVAWLRRLATAQGVVFEEASVTAEELAAADEVLIVGVPFCVLPVAAVGGRTVGDGTVGPQAMRLLDAWSAEVGIDLGAQTAALVRRARSEEVAPA
jgi:amino-transferase class IV